MRLISLTFILFFLTDAAAQISGNDTAVFLSGIVYDELYHPLPYTHVIGLRSHHADVTDTLGIFSIPLMEGDSLWFRNIAFRDTIVAVSRKPESLAIQLRNRIYPLPEAKIFSWGSTYEDFKEAFVKLKVPEPIGEKLGLPRQDPDYVPFDMDEEKLKSAGFLIHSPLSYLYYKLSKKEKSARKVYKLNKNSERIERFWALVNSQKVSEMTGLTGKALDDFMAYLNSSLTCDFNCSEFEILSEIYRLHEAYKEQ
ncbi:MAG: hypothetical protein JXR52_03485 [Bacteroidales bacterium]|nr:hypothetical protein [Bacteroidales bacterium]